MDARTIQLELEIDSPGLRDALQPGDAYEASGVTVVIGQRSQGHGFGMAEVVQISVDIAVGVTSELAADVVKSGIKAVIRRARGSRGRSDGSRSGLTELIEHERNNEKSEPDKTSDQDPGDDAN